MIDKVSRYQRGNDDGRNSNSEFFKREAVLIVLGIRSRISWRYGLRRLPGKCMVVKSAVFIPRDDQHAFIPNWRVANSLVSGFDERFAVGYVSQRMLRRSVLVIVEHVVAGLDENVFIVVLGCMEIFVE